MWLPKNNVDFTKFHNKWNMVMVKDTLVDQDKVFARLDEQSKKLGKFGKRHQKDVMHVRRKIQFAFPIGHSHVWTIMDTTKNQTKT